jgi:hypothetical protein
MEHSEKIIHRQRKIEYSILGSESLSPKSIEEPFSPSASEYVPSSSASSESESVSLFPCYQKFVPCKFCLGFYSSKWLYRHVKTCKLQIGRNTTFSLPIPMGTKMTESDARQMTASGMANYMKRSFASLVQEVAPKKLPPKTWVVAASPEESDKTKQLTTTQLQRLD